MKPLGMKIGIIYKNTSVMNSSTLQQYIMPETIRVNLIVRRFGMYEFVYNGTAYLIHTDNVTLE